ncbi:MAG: fibronectin type III domain-containing protein [Mogibacterium sp.]|nr:fibronectin type III domain-containing protein [Mogibacterium sp.]
MISRTARFHAFILVLVMAFSMMPCLSFAESGEQTGEELLNEYLDAQVGENSDGQITATRTAKTTRRDRLSDPDKEIYDSLRTQIEEVTNGSRSSAVFEVPLTSAWEDYLERDETLSQGWLCRITAESLGVNRIFEQYTASGSAAANWEMTDSAQARLYNMSAVIDALMFDLPYDLFWFDKTAAGSYSYSLNAWITDGTDMFFDEEPAVTVALLVSSDYRSGVSSYETDAALISRASEAAAVISDIIDRNSGLSDLDKLTAYRDIICDLADYDKQAGQNGTYGDPWQLINVFDNDPSTNVVCEGYAKAFQYLCDLSTFDDPSIECRSVVGTMTGGTGAGSHMWNILHMDDGLNYLVDITNSDAGTIGFPDQLFLTGYDSGDVYDSYTYHISDGRTVTYRYDDACFGQYDVSELTLAGSDYTGCIHEWGEWTVTSPATCSRRGIETRVCGLDPSHIQTRETGDIDPAIHTLKQVSYVAPTVDTLGRNVYYRCTECGRCFRDTEGTVETTPEAESIPELIDISKCSFTPASATYTGKALTTTVTARYGSRKLTAGKDFTVTYYGNKNIGRAKITVRGKDRYTGIRTLYFNVNPKGTSVSKVSKAKKAFTVKWKKQTSKMPSSRITGYQIQYSTDSSFRTNVKTVTVKGYKKTSRKVSKLQAKTTYYVRVRTYMKTGGATYYSGWSAAKQIRTK